MSAAAQKIVWVCVSPKDYLPICANNSLSQIFSSTQYRPQAPYQKFIQTSAWRTPRFSPIFCRQGSTLGPDVEYLNSFWLDLCQLWWPSVPILANLEICEWQIWAAAKCRPDAQSNVSWSEMAQWEKRACSYPTQPTVFLANMSLQCKQILFENLFGFSGKWSGDEDFDLWFRNL